MSDPRRGVEARRNAERTLEQLAHDAAGGDSAALETVRRELQGPTYRLALRFLGDPHEAQDATQEILVRITTRLASFEGRSKLTTWAYTISTRILLRARRSPTEAAVGTADDYATFLVTHLATDDFPAQGAEYRELCEEVRISCTDGMLLCLIRPQRIAYLLGDVVGLSDVEGSAICECTPAAFRQRLARSRATLRRIIDRRCGLIDPTNPCSCGRQIEGSIDTGILDRNNLTFRGLPTEPDGEPTVDAETLRASRRPDRDRRRDRQPLPTRPLRPTGRRVGNAAASDAGRPRRAVAHSHADGAVSVAASVVNSHEPWRELGEKRCDTRRKPPSAPRSS